MIVSRSILTPSTRGAQKKLIVINKPRARINILMSEPKISSMLWQLLNDNTRSEEAPYFFICGQVGFSRKVYDTFVDIVNKNVNDDYNHSEKAKYFTYKLISDNRYVESIYTFYTGDAGLDQKIAVSELVLHNNK